MSFPAWMTDEEIEFVVQALFFVADHGHLFLPLYRSVWASV